MDPTKEQDTTVEILTFDSEKVTQAKKLDIQALEFQLKACVPRLKSTLNELRKARLVTNEVMALEFSV